MCGIIFVSMKNKGQAMSKLLKLYEGQKSRGTEGFGFCSIDKTGAIIWERSQDFESIKKKLHKSAGSEIMFHHRYPTSTINVKEASHPIKVSNKELRYDYYVIHNGVIRNDSTLKTKHEKLGYEYNTIIKTFYKAGKNEYIGEENYNDSEALAIELARYFEGLGKDIGASGSIAFMAYKVDKKSGKVLGLYYGRNDGNPLVKATWGNNKTISSQGVGETVASGEIIYLDYTTGKELREIVDVGDYEVKKTMGFTGGYNYNDYKYNSYSGAYSGYKYDDDIDYTLSNDEDVKENGFDDLYSEDYELLDELYEVDEMLKRRDLGQDEREFYSQQRKELLAGLSEDGRRLYDSMLG